MKFKQLLLLIAIVAMGAQTNYVFAQEVEDDFLDLSLEDLMNIEVTVASKTEERISDAPGVISVVTKEELARFGGMSLKDVLERVPSLTTLTGSFTDRNALASRGDMVKSTSSHVLILIDGRPTREIVEGGIISEMMGAFPVNIIERIEVIRGPGSVLYGNMAMSAVINIVTKGVDRNNVDYTEIFGPDGASGRTMQAQFSSGDFRATVGGRMLKKAPQAVSADVATFDFLTFETDTTTVSIEEPDEALGAFAKVSYKGFTFSTALQQYEAIYFEQGVFGVNKWNKNFYNLGYDFNISKKWKSSLNTTYNYAQMKTGDTPFIHRKSQDVVAEWTNYIAVSDNLNVVLGGLYNFIEGEEINTIDQEGGFQAGDQISTGSRGSIAIYGQADYWPVKDKLKLIGGFQANKYDDIDLDIVPRAGAIWYVTPRLNVKALYGQAFRAGTINETGIDYQGFFVGNPDIKPEKSENIDFGINYQGKKGQIGINYFHTNYSNSITQGGYNGDTVNLDLGNGFFFPIPVETYQNIDKYSFNGLEVEGKYYLTEELFLMGSMLYQVLDASDSTVRTPVADFSLKGGISYASKKGITASLFNIYNGPLDNQTWPADGLNPDGSQAYNILNAYLKFDFVKLMSWDTNKQLSAFIQAENVLDEKVWLPESGGATAAPYNLGRAVYFGITVGL